MKAAFVTHGNLSVIFTSYANHSVPYFSVE